MIPYETDKVKTNERGLVHFPIIVLACLLGVLVMASFAHSGEKGITGMLTKDSTSMVIIPVGYYPLIPNGALVKEADLIGSHLSAGEREAIILIKRLLILEEYKLLSDSLLVIESQLHYPKWMNELRSRINQVARPGKFRTVSATKTQFYLKKLQHKIDSLQVDLFQAQQAWQSKTGDPDQQHRLELIHFLEKGLNKARKDMVRQISQTDMPKGKQQGTAQRQVEVELFIMRMDSILDSTPVLSKKSGYIYFPTSIAGGKLNVYEILNQKDVCKWRFTPFDKDMSPLDAYTQIELHDKETNQMIVGEVLSKSESSLHILLPISIVNNDKTHWTILPAGSQATKNLLKQMLVWRCD